MAEQTGVNESTITIGNAADVSGPIPGLFQASQDAVRAYVAFFNATSTLCGRKLELKAYDTRTDSGASQQVYAAACEEVFAMVGSMSAFDSGGAPAAESCGIPDIRTVAASEGARECSVCFGAHSAGEGEYQNAIPDFVVKNYPESAKDAAYLYLNGGAPEANAPINVSAMERRGIEFSVIQGIDTGEVNYAPYVQRMKDAGVRAIFWTGAYQFSLRLRQAMQQQGFEPDVYVSTPTDYERAFVEQGGEIADGTTVYLDFVPFAEAGSNREMATYLAWLDRVKPGADPNYFGVFAWSAARLFVETAAGLGGSLTREAVLSTVKSINDWTGNGLHASQNVGGKTLAPGCMRFLLLVDGAWEASGGTKYDCAGVGGL